MRGQGEHHRTGRAVGTARGRNKVTCGREGGPGTAQEAASSRDLKGHLDHPVPLAGEK